jgi:hypothetical protein
VPDQTERVAIITVHGVADQQPGQTVGELARLLCHGGGGPPRYIEGEVQQILVPVAGLPASREEPVPDGRSELKIRPGRPSDFFLQQRGASVDGASPLAGDLGLTLTDYLQGRYQPGESDTLYQSTRVSLRRHADRKPVDLYEMYWADYSRLQPGGIRALSAAYQLMFHLSTLARDVVDQTSLATDGRGLLRVLQWLHAWCAWLLKGPAALLQLTMLLLVAFGATAFLPMELREPVLRIGGIVAAVALIGLALLAAQRAGGAAARVRAAIPAALGAFVCAAVAAAVVLLEDFDTIYFGTAVLLMVATGAALLQRYSRTVRGVRVVGYAALVYAVAMLVICAARVRPEVSSMYEWLLTAALNAGEYVFAALLSAMALLVMAQIAALLASFWLARDGGRDVTASLITARIGMVVSTSLFAILSLLLWSVIAYVVGLALNEFDYLPLLLGRGYRSASIFFDGQIEDVGRLFTPLVVLAAVVGGMAVAALAPSLREEISPRDDEQSVDWTQRLGRWWTGARKLLGSVFGVVVPVFGIVGGLLYLLFVEKKLFGVEGALEWFDQLNGDVLLMTGKWLAGGAVTITALGARFTQTFGKLRVALDAMLDVDNYFQDPPNRRPPRAQIFSRFASLLDYVRSRGYARLVIVSHSQGTVISADLLRYLNRTGRLHGFTGGMPLSLVTVGSPLRDLYATRFPFLYRWMGGPPEAFAGASPRASDLEAEEWINVYRAGDYVGRSIWTAPTEPTMLRVATVSDAGKVLASSEGDRTEFCLGAGAHTHYFANDAIALAVEIDRLVCRGAPPAATERGTTT